MTFHMNDKLYYQPYWLYIQLCMCPNKCTQWWCECPTQQFGPAWCQQLQYLQLPGVLYGVLQQPLLKLTMKFGAIFLCKWEPWLKLRRCVFYCYLAASGRDKDSVTFFWLIEVRTRGQLALSNGNVFMAIGESLWTNCIFPNPCSTFLHELKCSRTRRNFRSYNLRVDCVLPSRYVWIDDFYFMRNKLLWNTSSF